VKIVEVISTRATVSALVDVLHTTDAAERRRKPRQRPSIVAQQHEGRIEFHTRAGRVLDVIDAPDLSRLSQAERQLVATYQTSMKAAYERWQSLYPQRLSLTASEQAKLRRARRQMCDDLGKIIRFTDSIGKHLPDHYAVVHAECGQSRSGGGTATPGHRSRARARSPRERVRTIAPTGSQRRRR
jgi:hypothetical protein